MIFTFTLLTGWFTGTNEYIPHDSMVVEIIGCSYIEKVHTERKY